MSLATLHVLVVEDSADDFEALSETAADIDVGAASKIAFVRAADGEAAQRMLSVVTDSESAYDYVILDLNLPGMNGLDILRWARARPALRRVPIVILSTSTSVRERAACLEAGANAFHDKPTSYERYQETIREMLEYWGRQSSAPARWAQGEGRER